MPIRSLLDRYSRGDLTLAQLETELCAQTAAEPASFETTIAVIRARAQSGDLSVEDSQRLLAAMARQQTSGTQLRKPIAESAATLRHDASASENDRTRAGRRDEQAIAAATLLRPAPDDVRSTQQRPVVRDDIAQPIQKTQVIHERRASTLVPEPANSEPPAFEPGAVVRQRFVLESLIGKGGMGLVFAAIDKRKEEARDPNPRVAIKILNADFQTHPDALIALQREARKAQTLAHPNVVTVFDFDRDGDRVYMTMELLRGRPLEKIVREAKGKGVGRDAAIPIIRGIAEGLAYAHRKGIVHSDLKPGNVFLLEDGTPKILDFGIARAVPSHVGAEQDMFDAGSLGAYTEAYATAEMVQGTDPHPADDLYALGLIGYELLTGQHPYQFKGALQARELGLKPEMPKGLKRKEWRALERCLAFERSARPRDATEFIKLFFGTTPLQKSLIVAIVVLAIASGYFWYREYQANGPAISFEQLSPTTQTQFKSLMAGGDQEWGFYEKDHNVVALWDALDQYADAYKLHPRNRDATRALQRTAQAALDAAKNDPEQRRAMAEALAEKSEYLSKYGPVMEAGREAR